MVVAPVGCHAAARVSSCTLIVQGCQASRSRQARPAARGIVAIRAGSTHSHHRDRPPKAGEEELFKAINTIRFLSIDGVNKANSGHPGLPMGCAPMAYLLFNEYMTYNPKEPPVVRPGSLRAVCGARLHAAVFPDAPGRLRERAGERMHLDCTMMSTRALYTAYHAAQAFA